MILDHWLDIFDSLSNNKLISYSSCLIWLVSPPWLAIFCTHCNCFFFHSRSWQKLPKHFLLHQVSSSPHLSTFRGTCVGLGSLILSFHTASIVSLHPLSNIHICSKWKGFRKRQSIPSGMIHCGLWLKQVTSILWTFAPGKFDSHSFVQIAR